jgi:preprotein translocase subunit SecB
VDFKLDMTAVARVASRVQLKGIRLKDLAVKSEGESVTNQLSADIERECVASKCEADKIEVTCRYRFQAKDAEQSIAVIAATYGLDYAVEGPDPIAPADAEHFAFANGAYNSWPFARELFHSMTGRLGLTPYVLPVLTFSPPRPRLPATAAKKAIAAAKKP